MRKYIRHPSNVPIHYTLADVVAHEKEYLKNISQGGLCFSANAPIEPGSSILIQIPIRDPMFEAVGIVVWNHKTNSHYDVAVEFSDVKTGTRLRIVEEVCHIEKYKKDMLENEGRELTSEEAAIEWIQKYVKDFPH